MFGLITGFILCGRDPTFIQFLLFMRFHISYLHSIMGKFFRHDLVFQLLIVPFLHILSRVKTCGGRATNSLPLMLMSAIVLDPRLHTSCYKTLVHNLKPRKHDSAEWSVYPVWLVCWTWVANGCVLWRLMRLSLQQFSPFTTPYSNLCVDLSCDIMV